MRVSRLLILLVSVTACSRPPARSVTGNEAVVHGLPFHASLLDAPVSFSLLGKDSIVITAGKQTDLHYPASGAYKKRNAPKFLIGFNGDFDLSVKVAPVFQSRFDGGALLFYTDTSNWAKILFQSTGNGRILGMSVVRENQTDDSYFATQAGDLIYLRLKKQGKVAAFYVSGDGVQWQLARQFVYAKEGRPGFYVQSPTGDSCRVIFSQIVYKLLQ